MINLALHAQRWAAAWLQLTRVGLRPQRLPGVHGAWLPQQQRAVLYSEELNRRQYHQPLCEAEIGCYASHLAAWQRLLQSDAPCAAVLEDDVDVDASLPEVLRAIEALPGEWDMVKLIGRHQEKVAQAQPLCEGSSLVRYARVPSLTGGYVLHRRGARKLLQQRRPFGRPVDVDLRYWWECGLELYGVQPYPLREGPMASESSMVGRGIERSAAMRWRKLCQQAHYSWCNRRALRAQEQRALPGPGPASAAMTTTPAGVAQRLVPHAGHDAG
ncbi:glycosyltransferase family 25 protein [Azohydromonas aeria]|uniref:glycosyltransferase family 25 protein n=1 Tax=Azohydromonas aeria TaxID=2590212 RepID=UPI0012FCE366|nr:glycosyltransferase family 25 protein [Azohydromonas aeria]